MGKKKEKELEKQIEDLKNQVEELARAEAQRERDRRYNAIYGTNKGYTSDAGRPSSSWYLDEPFGRDQEWEPMNR